MLFLHDGLPQRISAPGAVAGLSVSTLWKTFLVKHSCPLFSENTYTPGRSRGSRNPYVVQFREHFSRCLLLRVLFTFFFKKLVCCLDL